MKTFFLLLVAAIAVAAVVAQSAYSDAERAEWNEYKKTHGKSYEGAEDDRRHGIYRDTKKKVTEHNAKYDAGQVSYTLGINQFADLLPEEVPRGGLRPRS